MAILIPVLWGSKTHFISRGACDLRQAVEEAILLGVRLHEVCLYGAQLVGGRFRGGDFRKSSFGSANIELADFREANLMEVSFADAKLRGARFEGADLTNVNFEGVDLAGARFAGARLGGFFAQTLAGADLSEARFEGATLDGELLTRTPKTVSGLTWPVVITEGFMRIGCERHPHADWASFTAWEIREMHPVAWKFWETWKETLLEMCEKQRPVTQI